MEDKEDEGCRMLSCGLDVSCEVFSGSEVLRVCLLSIIAQKSARIRTTTVVQGGGRRASSSSSDLGVDTVWKLGKSEWVMGV